uniref:Uncharacterized protein n=1 Tax=Anguilla anguilla TaxID=7936 RepID=A0A0E9USL6_ANGAN
MVLFQIVCLWSGNLCHNKYTLKLSLIVVEGFLKEKWYGFGSSSKEVSNVNTSLMCK